MVSPRGRREQVSFLRDRGLSQRRACGLLYVPRSTLGYRLRQPEKDAAVLVAMSRLSAQYPRYGYRRIRIFLRREGLAMGVNRTRRLWRQASACRANGHAAGLPRVDHVRCRRERPTTSGHTTSYSIPAPTASSSSV